jgi:hypothetical protein
MDNTSTNEYSFNQQDYECVIRLYNGVNDVYLSNTGWDNLYLEDNIFDIFVRGSIMINSPYESFERFSDDSLVFGTNASQATYKFRNDGRDTLYISIKPKSNNTLQVLNNSDTPVFDDEKWLIELETVIYDVQDIVGGGLTDKKKKLFFWEKTYQMMTEKNHEFTTANTGSNKGKTGQDQASDNERKLMSGEALLELFRSDKLFSQHVSTITEFGDKWNKGHPKHTIFYASSISDKFINMVHHLNDLFVSDKGYPAILKLERSKTKGKPKQFSLSPIEYYFKQAGKNEPGLYQNEHFFLEESSYDSKSPLLKKSPISTENFKEFKADEYNRIRNYKLVDFSGLDYSTNLAPRNVTYYNSTNKQWIIDKDEGTEQVWKKFYSEVIANNVLIDKGNKTERLPITPYIKNRNNTNTVFSTHNTKAGVRAESACKLIKYFVFSNLGISFTSRGLTMRQPGRFFAVSKQTQNDKEYDHKLEGQYFVVNVMHHFSTSSRGYQTELTAVKTHTFREETSLPEGDVLIINKP